MARSRPILLSAVALTALASHDARAVEPPRPGQENFISRAVFGAARLWLLSDAGDLSTIRPGEKVRVPAKLPEPAIDLCVADGRVAALTCPRDACKALTLRRWVGDGWKADARIALEGEAVAAIACAPESYTILTDQRLIENVGGKVSARRLSGKLRRGLVTSLHVTADSVFAGINAGEWGGGLRRIDRKTGKVSVVEKNATGGLCGGPLNTECDPVNGIADEPWKPGCVAAAVGLIHFSSRGRIVEICKDDVRETFVKTMGNPTDKSGKTLGHSDTVAFFGLARSGNTLLASGIDGLYRFDGSTEPKLTPLPQFEVIGNVGVSFALPDAVLVLTGINRRLSMSGNVPLLVPTPEGKPYPWFDATFLKLPKVGSVPAAPAEWRTVKTKDGLAFRTGGDYRPRNDLCWETHADRWPGPGWKDVCVSRETRELLNDDFTLQPAVEGDRAVLSDAPRVTDMIIYDSWHAEAVTLRSRRAIVERARANGGMAGRKRERTLDVLIELGPGQWVRFTGKTGDDAGYDELLAIASTIDTAAP